MKDTIRPGRGSDRGAYVAPANTSAEKARRVKLMAANYKAHRPLWTGIKHG